MTATKTLLLLAALLVPGIAIAQDNPPPAEIPQGEPASEFRTFDPTEDEWENFRGAGNIPHEGGEAVYNAVCAGCHMPDGEGAIGAGAYPALADNELLESPAYPIYLVVNGQGGMPPFGGILDDEQIVAVVDYVRSHFGNDFVSGEFGETTPDDVAAARQ